MQGYTNKLCCSRAKQLIGHLPECTCNVPTRLQIYLLDTREATKLLPMDVHEYNYLNFTVRRDYSSPAARALRQPRRAPRLLVPGCTCSTSTLTRAASTHLHSPGCSDLPRLRRAPGASARRAARHAAHRRLLRRASGCLGASRGSSSTTSSSPRVRVPRHFARLVMRLVAWLVVVDYFVFAARPGASARRAARHAARRAARRRLLRLAQARRRLLRLAQARR
jgi:hypothetical protein